MLPDEVNKYESGVRYSVIKTIKLSIYYFYSYGRQIDKPVTYLGKDNIFFNDYQIQDYNDLPICGHLCVDVLNEQSTHRL